MSFLFIFASLIVGSYSITALVRGNDEECFFDEAQVGDEIHGTFAITHGNTPIDFKIFAPDDKIVLNLKQTYEDAFSFIANGGNGYYTICFKSNTNDLMTIDFSLHIGDDALIKNVIKKDEHLTPIEEAINKLKNGINELNEQVSYHRNRLKRHRLTTKSTNNRITYWSVIESIILIIISLIQTYVIKSFFEKKRYV